MADAGTVAAAEQAIFGADAWSEDLVREELLAGASYYLAAWGALGGESTSTLLGYGGIRCFEDADIMTLGVIPQARRLGIGRLLLVGLLDWARSQRVRRVFLEVRESNRGARSLYADLGFSEVGRTKRYYRHPVEDAVTMRLTLR